MDTGKFSRRELMTAVGLAGSMALWNEPIHGTPASSSSDSRRIWLTVNGAKCELDIAPDVTLLDALRDHLQLTGTKKGCDHGQCGACTVLVGSRRVLSCLTLAVSEDDGQPIETIEGLAHGDTLHPLQAAFIEHDAFQCGYCTPGQIMSAIGLMREGAAKDEQSIRDGMAGNICRCGAYAGILAAIRAVSAGDAP